jgi:hypothetical protein
MCKYNLYDLNAFIFYEKRGRIKELRALLKNTSFKTRVFLDPDGYIRIMVKSTLRRDEACKKIKNLLALLETNKFPVLKIELFISFRTQKR